MLLGFWYVGSVVAVERAEEVVRSTVARGTTLVEEAAERVHR